MKSRRYIILLFCALIFIIFASVIYANLFIDTDFVDGYTNSPAQNYSAGSLYISWDPWAEWIYAETHTGIYGENPAEASVFSFTNTNCYENTETGRHYCDHHGYPSALWIKEGPGKGSEAWSYSFHSTVDGDGGTWSDTTYANATY
jgi:hypothetical protein